MKSIVFLVLGSLTIIGGGSFAGEPIPSPNKTCVETVRQISASTALLDCDGDGLFECPISRLLTRRSACEVQSESVCVEPVNIIWEWAEDMYCLNGNCAVKTTYAEVIGKGCFTIF